MLLMKMGPVAFPNAKAVPMPAVTAVTSRVVFCQGVSAFTSALAAAAAAAGFGGGGAGRGAGGSISPFNVTIDPRTTSSVRSTPKDFSLGAIESRNLTMLFE